MLAKEVLETLALTKHGRAHVGRHILCDYQIAALATELNMICPFIGRKVSKYKGEPVLSYGLEPCGYSVRLGGDFKFGPTSLGQLDPKSPPKKEDYDTYHAYHESVFVNPHSMISGVTVERFHMPSDVQALCIGKSSYTRLGLLTQFTGIEPGFEGTITVQLINTTKQNIVVYPGEGVLQILFWLCPQPDSVYAGVYQGQKGVVTGRAR